MAVTHTDLVSPSMDLAARCINVSRVEIIMGRLGPPPPTHNNVG